MMNPMLDMITVDFNVPFSQVEVQKLEGKGAH
jgi:hypothetical protein